MASSKPIETKQLGNRTLHKIYDGSAHSALVNLWESGEFVLGLIALRSVKTTLLSYIGRTRKIDTQHSTSDDI
jgi:hypothetical protein